MLATEAARLWDELWEINGTIPDTYRERVDESGPPTRLTAAVRLSVDRMSIEIKGQRASIDRQQERIDNQAATITSLQAECDELRAGMANYRAECDRLRQSVRNPTETTPMTRDEFNRAMSDIPENYRANVSKGDGSPDLFKSLMARFPTVRLVPAHKPGMAPPRGVCFWPPYPEEVRNGSADE